MTLLLERNNINLPQSIRKRDNHYWDIQPERGHALMETVSKPRAILIDAGASNHMVERKESFSFLESDSNILIHMGYDSHIILKGKGTVKLEHHNFFMFCIYPPRPPIC